MTELLTVLLMLGMIVTVAAAIDSRAAEAGYEIVVATPKPDPPPVGCLDAQRGIRFYRAAYTQHRERMGLPGAPARGWYDCAATRRRAAMWQHRAAEARDQLHAWIRHHWAWTQWLPRSWYRLGSCETGYGGPPNWQHRNSAYEGAFGFAVSTWDGYKREALARFGDGPYPESAADATPRQQWNVALIVYGHFGMSGWGCRGAFYG